MSSSAYILNPSDAARQLGVSTKALRVYEERGLIAPVRTAAGWRTYGPAEMARAADIVALRTLRLSLTEIARVLNGDPQCLETALAEHQSTLEGHIHQLNEILDKVRTVRAQMARGHTPATGELAQALRPAPDIGCAHDISIAFDLPWPWGGEKFELPDIRPLNYITGPLGCGKTRLAKSIADIVPDGVFLGLDRLGQDGAAAHARLESDHALRISTERAVSWLTDEGATPSPALNALLAAVETAVSGVLVIDMIEQGLDQATQEVLVGYLRNRRPGAAPIFMLTRSSTILDMTAVGSDETIILCPANHSPPMLVAPFPGAPGYEAVTTCLASPDVRARTEGVVALRPQQT